MKTSIKILLLVLFAIGAVAGVLVFLKTRIAPPSNIKLIDQYSKNLTASCASFENISDFDQSRLEYMRIDDRMKRFVAENVLDPKECDESRKKVDDSYGKSLSAYAFNILNGSEWPEKKLNDIQAMMTSLRNDKLSTGDKAVSDEFITSADKFQSVLNDYHAALTLSRSTGYRSVSDASSKISKAKQYKSAEYLKNNSSLVSALNALPGKLAQSHYNYVAGTVNALGGYKSVSEDYFTNTLATRVDQALSEYKNTSIYGGNKKSVSNLEQRADALYREAYDYYEGN